MFLGFLFAVCVFVLGMRCLFLIAVLLAECFGMVCLAVVLVSFAF